MAYNLDLAARIWQSLEGFPSCQEKKMFGGIGFILNGNMACGILDDRLIVRVGTENYATALSQPYTRPFDAYNKPMSGWIMVDSTGTDNDAELKNWIRQGVEYASTLPPK